MTIHLYRRKGESRRWQALLYLNARRYRFSCLTDDKSTAREYARQRVEKLKARHNRGWLGLPEPIRMSEVFSRYEREYAPKLRPSSWTRTQVVLKQARDWFVGGPLGDAEVSHVTPGDVQAFLEQKLEMLKVRDMECVLEILVGIDEKPVRQVNTTLVRGPIPTTLCTLRESRECSHIDIWQARIFFERFGEGRKLLQHRAAKVFV